MSGDMGTMDPSDHTAECALPRMHDGQCANVPPAPPLVDTADLGHAERLAKLRDRAEAIIKADPVPTFGKAREEIAPPDAEPLPQRDDTTSPNCPVRSPHGDVCTLTRGHEGVHERHVAGERLASWETPTCGSRPEPYGWATRDTRCIGRVGHFGAHGDGNGLEWSGDRRDNDPVNDASSWIGKVFGGLGGPALKLTALNPQPVRVRFVDLPHRDVPREVLGVPAHTIEPGGFALVVDRFRNQAHRDAEGLMWENWGRQIGAASTFLYVGELDIVDYLSE